MNLGTNIFTLRTQKGLSQGDLADVLQVSRQSVSKWETGGATPDLDKLMALCDLFGVTLEELVRGQISEVPAAEPAAPAETATPTERTPAAESTPSTLRTVLICILVIFGLILLPTVFTNPSWWPGLLVVVVVGGLGFALWHRTDRNTNKGQLLRVLLIASLFLLPVIALANSLPDPPTYARAGELSAITPQDSPLECVRLDSGQSSVSYVFQNNSTETMIWITSSRRIEIKKDGKWYHLKELTTSSYDSVSIPLPPGEAHMYTFYCEPFYGKLSRGEYRVLTRIHPDGFPSQAYWIAEEFIRK